MPYARDTKTSPIKGTRTWHYSGPPFTHADSGEYENGVKVTLCGLVSKYGRVSDDPSCPDCLYMIREMKREKARTRKMEVTDE